MSTEKIKATRKAKPTKQQAIDEIVDLLGKIEKAEDDVAKSQSDWETQKEEAKTAKGVWMTRVSALRDLCRTRKKWAAEAKRQPLLNQVAKVAAPMVGVTDDTWKSVSLAGAAMQENHIDALEAAGVKTLGDLQSKMNQHGQFWAKELRINGRFRVAIEDTFNRYLTEITPAPAPAKDEPKPEAVDAA